MANGVTLIPATAAHALSALERTLELVEGLEVNSERMRENLQLSHQFVYAEAVMMALAPHLGRQRAHDLVDEAVSDARGGKPFFEALQQSEEINTILSESVLSKILSGQAHIDAAAQEVKEALANCDRGK